MVDSLKFIDGDSYVYKEDLSSPSFDLLTLIDDPEYLWVDGIEFTVMGEKGEVEIHRMHLGYDSSGRRILTYRNSQGRREEVMLARPPLFDYATEVIVGTSFVFLVKDKRVEYPIPYNTLAPVRLNRVERMALLGPPVYVDQNMFVGGGQPKIVRETSGREEYIGYLVDSPGILFSIDYLFTHPAMVYSIGILGAIDQRYHQGQLQYSIDVVYKGDKIFYYFSDKRVDRRYLMSVRSIDPANSPVFHYLGVDRPFKVIVYDGGEMKTLLIESVSRFIIFTNMDVSDVEHV